MTYAIIPARGGSKRIPRKNIRPFFNKPMLAWSIQAAKKCGCFTGVLVSTDDAEIAEVAKEYGAIVPFTRPKKISNDTATTVEVMEHAVRWCLEHEMVADNFCCLYATAPFTTSDDLKGAFSLLTEKKCDYVVPVTTFAYPIHRALQIDDSGKLSMFWPENVAIRSQDLAEAYHDVGQFYWGTTNAWLEKRPLLTSCSYPYPIPRTRVQDIDTEEDWIAAEQLFSQMAENRSTN